jgi:uncharacterized protein YuzE
MGGALMLTYSEDGDIVYIRLTDKKVAHTKTIDDLRIIDYDEDWNVVGVELIGASDGMDLRGLPEHDRLEVEAKVLKFPLLV